MSAPLVVRRLGRVEYADGLSLLEAFRTARVAGLIPDTLLLLEHFPVLTLGRKGRRSDVLASAEKLAARDLEIFETDRGGEVTYHGPGQLVAYPIIDLSPDRRDVRRYVRDLEETMLRVARDQGVLAGRVEGLNGIWLSADASPPSAGPARKLGAVGVHLSRWVTSHGFALNVNTDLSAFDLIVACGVHDRGVTSLQRELGAARQMAQVEDQVVRQFSALFDRTPREAPPDHTTVQVQVVRDGEAGPELLALQRTPARGGFWQPVTGHVEPGELAQTAAQRELFEETGWAAPVRSLDYSHAFFLPASDERSGWGSVAREVTFMAEVPRASLPRLSAEHECAAWLPLSEALGRFSFPGLRRAARLAAIPGLP